VPAGPPDGHINHVVLDSMLGLGLHGIDTAVRRFAVWGYVST